MKKIVLIATRDGKIELPASFIKDCFAVHKPEHNKDAKYYVITHIPTGYSLSTSRLLKTAKIKIELFNKLEIDWKNITIDNYKDSINESQWEELRRIGRID